MKKISQSNIGECVMSNKQIINGLRYEKLSEDQLYDLSQWELVDIVLAYRKDIKAKEQECVELNKTITNLENIRDEFSVKLDRLKAENEELKKCYKNNSALLDFEETNTTKLVNKVMKLEKTLTEIKEIAESCGWNFGSEILYKRIEQILQKISECEVNNG